MASQYARPVNAADALADLCEVSGQLVRAAIVEAGTPVASTFSDAAQAALFASRVSGIIEQAEIEARNHGVPELARLELATREGSVFAVRDGVWVVAATARPDAAAGLILYDLGRCLESVAARPEPRTKPAARRRPLPRDQEIDGAA
jgi:predicted regulator of Ras-like GTPase activity (Roadblock/LC7/MglB family)